MDLSILKIGKYTIKGYSKAGKATCIMIPELKIVFDLGVSLPDVAGYPLVCITHGHADHIGALHLHAFERRMSKLDNPTYLIPPNCVDNWLIAHDAMKRMNAHKNDICRQFKIDTSGNYDNGKYLVRWYDVPHKVPCKAYTIWDIRNKLKDEYKNMSKDEIIMLRKAGTEITRKEEIPIISYTGDTTINGVLQHDNLLNSDILIMECSFLFDVDIKEVEEKGHIMAPSIIENKDKFKNKHIVLTHFSKRYNDAEIEEARLKIESELGIPTYVL